MTIRSTDREPVSSATKKASGDKHFSLTSPDFADCATLRDAQAFNFWGCAGDNVSPAFSWSSAPPARRASRYSYTILMR
jgi:phosphatidylethanolamine-binding protein (PEBP) family uncharacterized protein